MVENSTCVNCKLDYSKQATAGEFAGETPAFHTIEHSQKKIANNCWKLPSNKLENFSNFGWQSETLRIRARNFARVHRTKHPWRGSGACGGRDVRPDGKEGPLGA